MRRTVLAVVFAPMIVLAGCSALPGGSDDARETPVGDEPVAGAGDDPGATGVNQTLRITVDGTTNGTEWTGIGASYPRDRFGVASASTGGSSSASTPTATAASTAGSTRPASAASTTTVRGRDTAERRTEHYRYRHY